MNRGKSEEKGLNEVITKQLLQDFEASGESRDTFDLLALCNSNEATYSAKGSETRRLVQRRWNHIRGKSVEAYIKYLTRKQVIPGIATQADIVKYFDSLPPSPHQTAEMPNNKEEEEWMCSEDGSQRSRTPPPTSDRKAPPTNTAPSTPYTSHGSDADASFPRHVGFSPTLVVHTPPRATFSPAPSVPNTHVFGATSLMGAAAGGNAAGGLSWSTFQDGTKDNPWIVNVDGLHPERNREFDIDWVTKKKHRKWYRDIFHIRMSCSPFDHKKFKAMIPTGYPPEYKKRLVLVQGVSQCAWIKDTKKYHAGKAGITCEATKASHSNTQIHIANDPNRELCWWLLVFSPHICLDNQILSPDEFKIPTQYNSITSLANENQFNKDLRGMTIFWEIAVEGGKQIEQDDEGPDDKDLF
jgi:hypothetical protein